MTEHEEEPAARATTAGLAALSRHYGVTEAQITADITDIILTESEVLSHVSLESVAMSLAGALGALNGCGYDDAAVTAAEGLAGAPGQARPVYGVGKLPPAPRGPGNRRAGPGRSENDMEVIHS
jgi:hypothetical protein